MIGANYISLDYQLINGGLFMKKIVALFLVLILLFGVVGCSKEEDKSSGETSSGKTTTETSTTETKESDATTADKKMIIGVSLPSPANQWVGALIEAAEAEAKLDSDLYDIRVVVSDNPSAQVAAIEDLTQDELDVLVVLPIESAPLTPICEQVFEQGTKVLVVDRGISSEKFTTFLAGDNYGIGVEAAHYIGEKLNGTGNVVEILGIPSEIVTQRSEGFHDTIGELYPGIKVIAQANGDFSREPALTAMEDILEAHDAIDAVYSHDDEQSLGIKIAVENAGRQDEMFLTGAGGNKSVFELMMAGNSLIQATFIYSPMQGATAIRIAKAMASGVNLEKAVSEDIWLRMSLEDEYGSDALSVIKGEIPRIITLSASTVTEENVKDFYNPDSSY